MTMVGQCLDHPAIRDPPTGAVRDHAVKFRAQGRQLPQPAVHRGQLRAGDSIDGGAVAVGIVRQDQKRLDRPAWKPRITGVADESQAGDVGGAILPAVAAAARRFRQQAARLVKPDRRDFDAQGAGDDCSRGRSSLRGGGRLL